MGAKSTCHVTREDALASICQRLLTASDEQIEDVMESLYGDEYLYNFQVVPEYDGDWMNEWKKIPS